MFSAYKEIIVKKLIAALAVVMFCLIMIADVTEAKVYIWIDEDQQTHYCNDPDDVPEEYKENCRTIETKASSRGISKSNAGGATAELQSLRDRSRALSKEMASLRKQGVSPTSIQYNELKKEYIAVRKQIRQLYNQKKKNQKKINEGQSFY